MYFPNTNAHQENKFHVHFSPIIDIVGYWSGLTLEVIALASWTVVMENVVQAI